MSIVALGVILFDAGMNVDITLLFRTMIKSTFLSVFSILASIVFVGLALQYFMPENFTFLQAILLGSMIGGTSTVAVFGILNE